MQQGHLFLLIATLLIASPCAVAADYRGENPYEPQADLFRPQLLIVGGSSSGTAAAISAGRLGIDTVWTLRAPRDMGGLSTNAINPDTDLAVRYIGGLALEYDVVARHTTGFNVGGRHNGEGYFAPFHVFFNYTREQIDALKTVEVLSNLVPIKVDKDRRTKRVMRVVFQHRLDPERRIVVEPQITIDAEIEGDVAHLAGVSMTLLREGRSPSDDPTRDNESYAGRIFTPEKSLGWGVKVAGGRLLEGSTGAADERAATMAWNGSLSIENYGRGTPDSPWVLKQQPPDYAPDEFAWWDGDLYGVNLGDNHHRWNIDPYLSTVEGWRLKDGRHVLESMDLADREANEKSHLARVIRALWHLQHTRKKYHYGLSHADFREGLAAKYMLSDFGTTTNDGDQPVPGLIYMREGRRLVNDHVFGGKLIEDDGSGNYVQKRYWHPRAAYFNAMLVDIHGVHRETAAGSGPEGMQLLRLAGFHHFGAPCIPFDVFLPRTTEATGLLLSSAGAYTHQAYAAFPRMETGRIAQGHACAIAAYHALREKKLPHEVDVRRIQITNLLRHGLSLVYLEDTIPGTYCHLVDQMLAARRVPERNEQGVFQREDQLTVDEARIYLQRLFRDYAEQPLAAEKLDAVMAHLGATGDEAVTRSRLITAISHAAGVEPEQNGASKGNFADVPADSDLGRLLTAWVKRGWIKPSAQHQFEPDAPLPFAEFKRHAFHALFASVVPETVRAVDYRATFANDTFNRPNEETKRLASGQPVASASAWRIEGGNLRAVAGDGTSYLLLDVVSNNVDISVDIFLEQTKQPAAAGIVVRAKDDANMQRFLLDTDGAQVRMRIDTLFEGRRTDEIIRPRATHRRAFTLRLVADDDLLTYFVDGEQVHQQQRSDLAQATRVGILNGGHIPSRFDNLEVRAVE